MVLVILVRVEGAAAVDRFVVGVAFLQVDVSAVSSTDLAVLSSSALLSPQDLALLAMVLSSSTTTRRMALSACL